METNIQSVRVNDIILDGSHPRYKALGEYDAIGTIMWSDLNQPHPHSTYNLPVARPFFSSLKQYPLINEIVLIIFLPKPSFHDDGDMDYYYLPPTAIHKSPLHNALPKSLISNAQLLTHKQIEAGASYKSNLGNKEHPEGDKSILLGQNFKELDNINPLLPYEGDVLLEGRFGNSIRFGSNIEYNSPITIIRNGQSDSHKSTDNFQHTKENINTDDSSIYLSSEQKINDFKPASVHQESFGIYYDESTKIEPTIPNNHMDINTEEEIIFHSPPPPTLPDNVFNELENYDDSGPVVHDVGETEIENLDYDEDALPSTTVIPSGSIIT